MTSGSRNIGRGAFLTLRVLLLAVVVGAVLAAVTKGLFQAVIWIIDLLWTELPEAIGVNREGIWFMVSVLGTGGVLVGLGNRLLGYYPKPLEEVTEEMKEGEPIPHRTIPATLANSVASLGFGGPLGPESMLVSVVGGLFFWVDVRMRGMATSVFTALTGRDEKDAGKPWQYAPTLIASISVVVVFHELPGGIDLSFVPAPDDPAAWEAIVMALVAGLVGGAVGLLTSKLHIRARSLAFFSRAPELVGLAAGVVVALLAMGSFEVLFSGAEETMYLFDGSLDTGEMSFASVGKWLGLLITIAAGWKGGPIFPLMFCLGALGVAAGDLLGLDGVILYAGGVAGVVAGALGSMALGVLVALLVVPTTLIVPLIVGAGAAGLVLRLSGSHST